MEQSIIAGLIGLILGGAGSALVVWVPIKNEVARIQTELAVVSKQLLGVLDWQKAFDQRAFDRLDELEKRAK